MFMTWVFIIEAIVLFVLLFLLIEKEVSYRRWKNKLSIGLKFEFFFERENPWEKDAVKIYEIEDIKDGFIRYFDIEMPESHGARKIKDFYEWWKKHRME